LFTIIKREKKMSQISPSLIPHKDQEIIKNIAYLFVNLFRYTNNIPHFAQITQDMENQMQQLSMPTQSSLTELLESLKQSIIKAIQQYQKEQERPLPVTTSLPPLAFANHDATIENFPDISSYYRFPTSILESLIPTNPDDLFRGLRPEDYRSLNEHADPDFFEKIDKTPGIY
jgi:hypothetical protein